jgi:hypothetical protein
MEVVVWSKTMLQLEIKETRLIFNPPDPFRFMSKKDP